MVTVPDVISDTNYVFTRLYCKHVLPPENITKSMVRLTINRYLLNQNT